MSRMTPRPLFSLMNTQSLPRHLLWLVLSAGMLLPLPAMADIVYGSVTGVIPGNLTLTVYKKDKMVIAAAIRHVGNNQYQYQLNLPPGEYQVVYEISDKNKVKRSIINYPGTNRANVDFQK